MRSIPAALCALSLLATPALAQGAYQVGTQTVAWPANTSQGPTVCNALVCYPATSPGANGGLLPPPTTAGWPTVVFLHGYGLLGSDYVDLGTRWASEGLCVVLVEDGQWDFLAEEASARAMLDALDQTNHRSYDPLRRAFDLDRVGLAGHSMGGGNVAVVLASNPGYRCGFALAPADPGPAITGQVHTPMGLIVGEGDLVTPWLTHGQPFYLGLTDCPELKFMSLLDLGCTHMNLAGLWLTNGADQQVYDLASSMGAGFLRHFLADDPSALERAVGPAALTAPHMIGIHMVVEKPQIWTAGPLRLGQTTRVSIAIEPGIGAMVSALSLAPATPTPYGQLLLDPASTFIAIAGIANYEHRADGFITVPNDPQLVGFDFALQAAGPARDHPLLLGEAFSLVVDQ